MVMSPWVEASQVAHRLRAEVGCLFVNCHVVFPPHPGPEFSVPLLLTGCLLSPLHLTRAPLLPSLHSGEVAGPQGPRLERLPATGVLPDRLQREEHRGAAGQAEPPVLPVCGGHAQGGGHQAASLPAGRNCRVDGPPRAPPPTLCGWLLYFKDM